MKTRRIYSLLVVAAMVIALGNTALAAAPSPSKVSTNQNYATTISLQHLKIPDDAQIGYTYTEKCGDGGELTVTVMDKKLIEPSTIDSANTELRTAAEIAPLYSYNLQLIRRHGQGIDEYPLTLIVTVYVDIYSSGSFRQFERVTYTNMGFDGASIYKVTNTNVQAIIQGGVGPLLQVFASAQLITEFTFTLSAEMQAKFLGNGFGVNASGGGVINFYKYCTTRDDHYA